MYIYKILLPSEREHQTLWYNVQQILKFQI